MRIWLKSRETKVVLTGNLNLTQSVYKNSNSHCCWFELVYIVFSFVKTLLLVAFVRTGQITLIEDCIQRKCCLLIYWKITSILFCSKFTFSWHTSFEDFYRFGFEIELNRDLFIPRMFHETVVLRCHKCYFELLYWLLLQRELNFESSQNNFFSWVRC